MNGVARARVGILETSSKNPKAKEISKTGRIRVYAHADTVFLQERLARALGSEKDFEVVMEAASATESRKNASSRAETEILVMFSSGLVPEDLHRVHGWKMAMQELKVLLLGASQNEAIFCSTCAAESTDSCRRIRRQKSSSRRFAI